MSIKPRLSGSLITPRIYAGLDHRPTGVWHQKVPHHTFHLFVISGWPPGSWKSFFVSLCVSWHEHFWRVQVSYWAGCPSVWVCLGLPRGYRGYACLAGPVQKQCCFSQGYHLWGCMMSACLITGDVNFNCLVKAVSARFPLKIYSSLSF